MKTGILALSLGLLASQVLACATLGETCSEGAKKRCVCDEGYLAICEAVVDGEYVEYIWIRGKNCPVPADGGVQCENGACTS
ncbi:hypothetical protein ASPZODRAFT_1284730 [Penicilliopsis zonata CBS 506.65]|uniref:Uncharacterized protein n=1 Tax=Penicilliopsis zonata CBS 506.65 TaxID=1073090 RepID=A0A1L9S655_9EURO|nr:hypothetical protein ASPZODRAFT_1284730 [Penicilliopsis zonata CBS 506.65]OJJ42642.1 hypothetical protein ASPZODRAFT_1284730 [Penicilliopsis zonata CBS 506.65]